MAAQAPLACRRSRPMLAAAMLVAACALAGGCDTGVPPAPPPGATATVAGPELTPADEDFPEWIPGLPPVVELTPVPTAAIEAEERLAIYVQVVLLLAGAERAPVVYVSPYTAEGERLDVTVTDRPVPSALIPALRQADPTRTYEAAEFQAVVGPLEEGGAVDDGGAFVTLGPVEDNPEVEGGVRVRATVYRAVGNAGGYTYELVRDPSEAGGWAVARTTQDWPERVP